MQYVWKFPLPAYLQEKVHVVQQCDHFTRSSSAGIAELQESPYTASHHFDMPKLHEYDSQRAVLHISCLESAK